MMLICWQRVLTRETWLSCDRRRYTRRAHTNFIPSSCWGEHENFQYADLLWIFICLQVALATRWASDTAASGGRSTTAWQSTGATSRLTWRAPGLLNTVAVCLSMEPMASVTLLASLVPHRRLGRTVAEPNGSSSSALVNRRSHLQTIAYNFKTVQT